MENGNIQRRDIREIKILAETRHIQSGDIYGKKIQDLYWKETYIKQEYIQK